MFEFVSISISLCVSLSLSQSIHLIYLSIQLSSIYQSVHLSIYLSIHPSIHLFIYLSICLSIYLCLYLSISISIFLDVSAYLCIVCSGRNLKWGYHRAQCRLGPSKARRFNLKDMWYTYMCMYLYMYNVCVYAYIHINYTDISTYHNLLIQMCKNDIMQGYNIVGTLSLQVDLYTLGQALVV